MSLFHFLHARPRLLARTRRKSIALRIEALEGRLAPSANVDNATDENDYDPKRDGTNYAGQDGQMSLREAINAVNHTGGTITFSGPMTINIDSSLGPLPVIKVGVTITGATGANGAPATVLSGGNVGGSGLVLKGGGSQVTGMVVNGFSGSGIDVEAGGATIENDYVGTDPSGSTAAPNGVGIFTGLKANGCTIKNCVVSGNHNDGIDLCSNGNMVLSTYVGTNTDGTSAIANGNEGIFVIGSKNVIGGTSSSDRDFIAANGGDGVGIDGTTATKNLVEDNYIGTDSSGAVAMANGFGVFIGSGASKNTIGGTTSSARNIISANTGDGILIGNSGAKSNTVDGNYIGLDVNGQALGNGGNGVYVQGASKNTIGGNSAGARNVIGSNGDAGVRIEAETSPLNLPAAKNKVEANYIGLDPTGMDARPNNDGIVVALAASHNTIGDQGEARNVISGNTDVGIEIKDSGSTENKIQNNYIGTDSNGTDASGPSAFLTGNGQHGILIVNASNNMIGGDDPDLGNTIAFNGDQNPIHARGHGIVIQSGKENSIRCNMIFKNRGLGISLGDDTLHTNNIPEADARANRGQHYPAVVGVDQASGTIHWMLNSTPHTRFTVDIFHDPENDYQEYAEGQVYVETLHLPATDAHGHVEFYTHDGIDRMTAIATDSDGNSSEFSLANLAGDGIADVWKTVGIDINETGTPDLHLQDIDAVAPDPHHKDLYVEVDALATVPVDHAAPGDVIGAFANAPANEIRNPDGGAGINLHVLYGDTNLTDSVWVDGSEWGSFNPLKQAHFASFLGGGRTPAQIQAATLICRYCIFADEFQDPGPPSSDVSGETRDLPSNDFFVALGPQSFWAGGTRQQQAGTFMHEFGHSLGLHHGGGGSDYYGNSLTRDRSAENNYKPNLHSVMNYLWQMPDPNYGPWFLDYSRQALNTLNERHLVEATGIGGDPGTTLIPNDHPAGPAVPEGGPVNWDNGPTPLNRVVARDVDGDGHLGDIFRSHADWPELTYYFLESPGVLAGHSVIQNQAALVSLSAPIHASPKAALAGPTSTQAASVAVAGPVNPGAVPMQSRPAGPSIEPSVVGPGWSLSGTVDHGILATSPVPPVIADTPVAASMTPSRSVMADQVGDSIADDDSLNPDLHVGIGKAG